METSTFHAWWTLVLLVVFVGIVIWAWSAKRKPDFDAASRLALDDEDEAAQTHPGEERRRG